MGGFFERFRRSWGLVKASATVLRSDRELLIFPLIAAIASVLIAITFFVPALVTGAFWNSADETISPLGYVLLFIFYVIQYTIVIACNAALVGAAMIRLRGGDPTVSDGIAVARQHATAIIGYALIAATVGVILQVIRERFAFVGQIVAGIVGTAWNLATFLVVPVLVVEGVGPVDAVKRSGAMLRRTWGEQIIGNGAISLIFVMIGVGVLLVGGFLIALVSAAGAVAMIIVGALVVMALAVVALVAAALNGIYTAALYRYATGEDVSGFFDPSLIQSAFVPDTKKS